jgi:hypothetical protein
MLGESFGMQNTPNATGEARMVGNPEAIVRLRGVIAKSVSKLAFTP